MQDPVINYRAFLTEVKNPTSVIILFEQSEQFKSIYMPTVLKFWTARIFISWND